MRWIACLLLASTALAGHRDNDTPDEAYLEAGERWAAVACEVSGEESPGVRAKGSGVAISPEWVLTAAHVTADAPIDMRVRFADGTTRGVALLVQEPRWKRENVGFHDIAILKLDKPIGNAEFPPLGQAEPGRVVQVAGFGMFGKLDGGELDHDGRLRAGNAVIRELSRSCYLCVADRGCCKLLYHIASGDSGGPLFNADGELVGIHSYTSRLSGRRRGQYGEESAHTQVWAYRDWIRETMEENQ